jgi:hypothetical protein
MQGTLAGRLRSFADLNFLIVNMRHRFGRLRGTIRRAAT